jgi:mannose-1-phosphate guanylyltransferase/mannose-6-phosphate isomerase
MIFMAFHIGWHAGSDHRWSPGLTAGGNVVANIYPVIVCGGSGTRLWPLSRLDFPKQFAVIRDGKSLFERTYERARNFAPASQIICVAHHDYRFLIKAVTGDDNPTDMLLLEPARRNTAAAIASAALYVSRIEPAAVLACMPADHEIPSTERFNKTLATAVAIASQGWITIMGVAPTHPATSYGYIKPGHQVSDTARAVERFVEKPDEAAAQQYFRQGYRWSSGLVVAPAEELLGALLRRVPDVVSACERAMEKSIRESGVIWLESESFLACQTISFDNAVLEHHDRLAVTDFDGEWNDVGSWTEVARFHPRDSFSNRISGQVEMRACENTFIHSPDRLTVALGLRDLIVVNTADALLISDRSRLGELRNVVSELWTENRKEMISHRMVARPWGWFQLIDQGMNYQVKRIMVNPAGLLSLQYHRHRAEHWVVVKGTGLVTCGEQQFTLRENESTYIPQGAVHRLENPGNSSLEVIEVQSGSYLGEDDIVRLDDRYGRADKVKPGEGKV